MNFGGRLDRAWEKHYSDGSPRVEWYTPPWLISALGSFDLDPAAPAVRLFETAKQYYTKAENGLVQPWFGRVYLNPPYERAVERWMSRLADHGNGIAPIFARHPVR